MEQRTGYNPYANRKHPPKYSRDGGGNLTPGDVARGVGKLIDAGASSAVISRYIDEEFLWGAWGCEIDDLDKRNPDFCRDLRGVMISMYKAGKGTLETNEEANWASEGPWWYERYPRDRYDHIGHPDECPHADKPRCKCICISGRGKGEVWTREFGSFTVE